LRSYFEENEEIMTNSTAPSSSKVLHVADAQFAATIKNHPAVIVDCYADWCGPCRAIAPMVEALAEEYAGRVTFVKVDVDNAPNVAMEYGIRAIPTMLFFKGGKLVDQQVGALPKHSLKQRVDALLEE
jgi:thioredoxin 1